MHGRGVDGRGGGEVEVGGKVRKERWRLEGKVRKGGGDGRDGKGREDRKGKEGKRRDGKIRKRRKAKERLI